MEEALLYKRILLKLSGETLMGDSDFGIDISQCRQVASSIKKLIDSGLQVAIVIGAGNIFRGVKGTAEGMPHVLADQMGMVSTIINGIALGQVLKETGCQSRVISSITCGNFVELYQWDRAIKYLENKNVLIFVGGTGNPFCTTDSAAALRACEIGADALLKATKVDGIYNKDPLKYADAVKYDRLRYDDVLSLNLKVMDATSIAMCRYKQIPIRVFNFFTGDIMRAVTEENYGTLVC
jgi:uridylate kinase